MEKGDLLKMSSKDLSFYVMNGQIHDDFYDKDRNFADMVGLLYYAQPDKEKAQSILKKVIKDGKKLVAIYPMLGDKKTPNLEYIGEIIDGALYLG